MNKNEKKIVLPRLGIDHLWEDMQKHYAARNRVKWKHFAMLTLAELGNWPLDQIAIAMDHSPGHISRCITKIKNELRETFTDPFCENPPQLSEDVSEMETESGVTIERASKSAFDKLVSGRGTDDRS